MHQNNFFKIKEIKLSAPQWRLIGDVAYIEYVKDYISAFDDICYFSEYSNKNDDFRWFIEIKSMQFFLGVFSSEKTIRLCSKNMSKELTLLNVNLNDQISGKDYDFHEELSEYCQKLNQINIENTPSIIEFNSFCYSLPLFTEERYQTVHNKTELLMLELVSEIKNYKQSLLEKLTDYGLSLTANFLLIRIHVLKYLAILPNLSHDTSGDEVKRLLIETLTRLIQDNEKAKRKRLKGQKRALPRHLEILCKIVLRIFELAPAKILAKLIRYSVGVMAQRFIAGENISSAKSSLEQLENSNRSATIDQLGELVVSKQEADDYTQKVLDIIEGLKNPGTADDINSAGIYKAHVSIKVTALTNDFKPQDFQYTFDQIAPRLSKILLKAKASNVFLNIDAEHYSYRDMVFKIYANTLEAERELHDYQQTGIVVQAYLRDAFNHFNEIKNFAIKRKLIMPIRLVKGAYWDGETIEAEAHNFPAPEFLNKEETDLHFRQLVYAALENHTSIQLAVASHNIQDHCFARTMREELFPKASVIEHQCLHMTYEGLSVAMAQKKWATRNYIPVGNLLVGMAYLVRRIMENSSQVGVLTIMRSHKKGLLYGNSFELLEEKRKNKTYCYDKECTHLSSNFKNIYPLRTFREDHLNLLKVELDRQMHQLQNENLYYSDGDKKVICSSDPSLVLGLIKYDSIDLLNQKMISLYEGFHRDHWRNNLSYRIGCFSKLVDLLLINREMLTSMILLEAGKTLDEASADIDEGIDFIQFYLQKYLIESVDEEFCAKGVVGVIAPWNFPLAIACGMTIAPLVCGNTVVLKPAEQTPLIAKKFVELCYEAGIPDDVFQIVLGDEKIGKAIVDHELIVGIVFTGSKSVGETIYKKIVKQNISEKYGYGNVSKFAITEMGGKNAIIVTNNCELDETVAGIIYSAFAHSGQKCSAASRVIIDKNILDAFIMRFRSAIYDLQVGAATKFSTLINPLISQADKLRVQEMAKEASEEIKRFGGEVIVDLSRKDYPGFCVGPSVFLVGENCDIKNYSVANTEVFGPILHLIPYNTLDDAIHLFNNTEYALTGGVFCQSQDDLDFILPRLEAGNIYVNRANTGARVAIEPFGGFKMSGTGPKAGSKEYLENFYFQRKNIITENDLLFIEKNDIQQDFNLSHPFQKKIEDRLQVCKQILSSLINEKEILFMGSSNIELSQFHAFAEQIEQGVFHLEQMQYQNHYIPGQLSYNKKNMAIGNGLFIESGEFLNVYSVIDFLINIIAGNGLNIICTHYNIFKSWEEVLDLSYNYGLSRYNISLNLMSKNELEMILKSEDFHFLQFSRYESSNEYIGMYLGKEFKMYIPKVFILNSEVNMEKRLNKFVHQRSFAINTMRHGAPLELSL